MKTPANFVEDFFNLGQRLLKTELHEILDKLAAEVLAVGDSDSVASFPYKTFNESLTFVVTSMMREILQSSSGKTFSKQISLQLHFPKGVNLKGLLSEIVQPKIHIKIVLTFKLC